MRCISRRMRALKALHFINSLYSWTENQPAVDDLENLTYDPSASELSPSLNDAVCCVDFQDLFPDHDLRQHKLTVITLSQNTENNMTMWSPEVDEERELLLENVSDRRLLI